MLAGVERRLYSVVGAGLVMVSLLLLLALLTYSPADPSLNTAADARAGNYLGPQGAVVADVLIQSVGLAAYLLPAVLLGWAFRLMLQRPIRRLPRRLVMLVLALLFGGLACSILNPAMSLPAGPGGTVNVPLEKVTPGGTAHYVSTLHLTDGAIVTNATAVIYSSWSGRFVLSCPEATPTPTNTPTKTATSTSTATKTSTATSSPTSTATKTSTPTNTLTNTPTRTATPVTPTPTGKSFTKTVVLVNGNPPVGSPAQVAPGSTVVYQIVVTGVTPNLGGFEVTEHVPTGTTFVAVEPPGTPTNPSLPVTGAADVTISNITSDGAGSFTLRVTLQISGAASCGSTITNSASFPLTPNATAPVQVVCA